MAERASIFETVRVGVETTPGTAVTANKQLLGLVIEGGIKTEVDLYRGSGLKFPIASAQAKEWSEATISGPITYTDLVYVLASLVNYAAPVTVGALNTWTFAPSTSGPDTTKTFTVDQGSSVRAHRFTYGLVTDATLSFSRDECTISGNMIGQELEDAVTLAVSPTQIPLVPVTPTQVLVSLATTQAGLAGATPLARTFSASVALTGRFKPVWVLDGAKSFAAHVEGEPSLTAQVLMSADNVGMAQLPKMQAGDMVWMRIKATGGIADGVTPYSLTIDMATKITDVSNFSDQDGVYAIEWTLTGVHDITWNKALQIVIVTTGMAAL